MFVNRTLYKSYERRVVSSTVVVTAERLRDTAIVFPIATYAIIGILFEMYRVTLEAR